MKKFTIYPLIAIAVMMLSGCNLPPMSQVATLTNITEDLQVVVEMEGREDTLKLCGIEANAAAKEYIEQFRGKRVAVVKHGKQADIFVSDGNGGELYLNGILVMENLAEVDENAAKHCSDPSAFETAKQLRES